MFDGVRDASRTEKSRSAHLRASDPTLAAVLRRKHTPFYDPLTLARVYFLHAPGVGVKIGLSKDPKGRMRHIQTTCPAKLVFVGDIMGDRTTEKVLHRRLANYRLHGEWFSEEILPLCERIVAEPEILRPAA